MDVKAFLIGSLLAAVCGLGVSNAQSTPPAKPVSYDYFQQDTEPTVTNAFPTVQQAPIAGPVAVAEPVATEEYYEPVADHCAVNQNCAENCGCRGGCPGSWWTRDLGEPRKLFRGIRNPPILDVGGWFSAGYTTESTGLFNSNQDGFNLSQAWMYVEKPVKIGPRAGFNWGFRVDSLYGVDADDVQAFGNIPDGMGNPRGWDNDYDHGIYGFAVPQTYVELGFNRLSVKVGHFFSITGYEQVADRDNFFYSYSMTRYLSEPFTHSGLLTTICASECLSLYAGWTAGWDTGFDQGLEGSNFIGGFTRTFNDDFAFTYTTNIGDFGYRGAEAYMHTVLLETRYTDCLYAVTQSDYLRVESTGEDNIGINQFFFYECCDRLTLGTRFEWWRGDALVGYAPHGGVIPAGNGANSYYEITTGCNFWLNSNIVCRPEFRYDWSPAVDYSMGIFAIDFVATF